MADDPAATPPAGDTPPAAPPPSNAPGDGTSLAGGTPPEPPKQPDPPAPAPELKLESLKLPDGMKLEGDMKDGFAKAIAEADPNKRAQALLDLYAGESKKIAEAAHKGFHDLNQKWVGEVKADAEIGGDKWPQVAATIAKGLDTYGTPGVRQALNLTGAGNNPEVIKTLYKMASALAEGGHVGGNPPAGSGEKDLSELMYPAMKGNG
jgi:hypothetical protein